MHPERFRQLELVFHEAVALPAAERPAFLDRACAGDPLIRKEVEALLASDENADTHIGGVVQGVAASLDAELPGEVDDGERALRDAERIARKRLHARSTYVVTELLQARAASDSGMVLVTTTSSRAVPLAMRSMAGPEKIGCVQ